jgi:hypothetical protein
MSWFAARLDQVVRDVEAVHNEGHDIAVEINIYVTDEDGLTSSQASTNGDRVELFGNTEILPTTISADQIPFSPFEKSYTLSNSRIFIPSGWLEVTDIIRKHSREKIG